MRHDEDGTLWLTPREWLPWVMANYPERLRESLTPPPAAQEMEPPRPPDRQNELFADRYATND
jgi:hypothetical protein